MSRTIFIAVLVMVPAIAWATVRTNIQAFLACNRELVTEEPSLALQINFDYNVLATQSGEILANVRADIEGELTELTQHQMHLPHKLSPEQISNGKNMVLLVSKVEAGEVRFVVYSPFMGIVWSYITSDLEAKAAWTNTEEVTITHHDQTKNVYNVVSQESEDHSSLGHRIHRFFDHLVTHGDGES